ncbi:MAG: 1-deoxy-D-xylulose-5-phosphate reductoisomerase [Desulfobacterales bacterium]
MKRLSILGSTGSIGRNTLAVAARFPDEFAVVALAAKSSLALLGEQIAAFKPEVAVVHDEGLVDKLRAMLPQGSRTRVLCGAEGYRQAASLPSVDMVVSAMVGAAGLAPTLAAIDAGKDVALANKETLVVAGEIVMQRAAARKVRIVPVDSEHSAIFQCLAGSRPEDLGRILLTASGGPFLHRPATEFGGITPEAALKHPNWQMGPKITIDSATLMNKGLEVIEAKWLFDVALSQIEVLVHPQSIVHSMVAFRDGSVLAQMGVPDMKGAIAYALSYPQRLPLDQPLPDFSAGTALTFQKPDVDKFPCLALAFRAGESGGTLPAVMNAANEVVVQAFLNGRIGFTRIPQVIGAVMDRHATIDKPDLAALREADRWARKAAGERIDAL